MESDTAVARGACVDPLGGADPTTVEASTPAPPTDDLELGFRPSHHGATQGEGRETISIYGQAY